MPPRSSSKRFVLFGGALVACVLVSTVIVSQMQRNSLIDVYQGETANRAVAMDLVTVKMLGPIDRALTVLAASGLASGMASGTADPAVTRTPSLAHRLTEVRELLPAVESLALLDADGRILEASDGGPAAAVEPGRLAGFVAPVGAATAIGAPLRSPLTGAWIITMSRRMADRPGAAARFVVASVALAAIERSYGLATSDARAVALFRRDGVLLASYPPREAVRGQRPPDEAGWYGAVGQGGGNFHDYGMSDDGRIIAAVRLVPGLPLVVQVSVRESEALTDWYRDLWWVILGAILSILAIVVLMRSLDRHFRGVALSEASLAARNRELETARQQFDAVLSNISQGVCFFSGDRKLIVSNRRYAEIYSLLPNVIRPGLALTEVIDLRFAAGSFPNCTREEYLDSRDAVARSAQPTQTLVELKNGRTVSVRHQPMPDGGWVATHEDITEQREAEAKIAHMARHDALTGLANRSLFMERIARALVAAEHGAGFAVLYLDLDRFKAVNDTLGHQVGDDLLRAVAARLRACVREADTVARFGGDEFVILQDSAHTPDDAAHLAERILGKLGEPCLIGQQDIAIRSSIGIAVAPADGAAADTLLKNADTALYIAKSSGRGTFRFFEPEMDARAQRRHYLEQGLRGAISRGELELHYQPIIDLASGLPRAFEALIRWNDPVYGPISPADFVPIAEEAGLIVPIGEWVLRQACQAAAEWPADINVAVNLSAVQFRLTDLDQVVAAVLQASGLQASRLEIEITESVLLQHAQATLGTLHALRAAGVSIVMDDFGAGYSSLSYLRDFPFDKVKIDHSFTRDIARQVGARSIVSAVIGLCRDLGVRTTVEGVETLDQLAILRAEQCAEVQGFLFSAPVPLEQVAALIAQGSLFTAGVLDRETKAAFAL